MKSLLFVSAALLVGGTAQAQQSTPVEVPVEKTSDKVLLRLKLVPGQKFKLTTELEFQTTINTPAGPTIMRQSTTAVAFDEVQGIAPDGNIQMRRTFGETATTLQWKHGAGISSRTSNPFEAIEKAATKAMVGRSVDYTLSPRGRVLEVRGVDKLVQALTKTASASPASDRPMLKMIAEAQGRSMSLKDKGLLQSTIALPERAVGAGESWDNGPIVLQPTIADNTYSRSTLTSRDNGISKLALLVELRQPVKKAGANPGPIPGVIARHTGQGKGSIEIDEATGVTRRSFTATYLVSKFAGMNFSSGKAPTINAAAPETTMYTRIQSRLRNEHVAQ